MQVEAPSHSHVGHQNWPYSPALPAHCVDPLPAIDDGVHLDPHRDVGGVATCSCKHGQVYVLLS